MVETGMTAATVPCTPERKLAHRWVFRQERPGDPYSEGLCAYCGKRRLGKMAWPARLDWPSIKAERQAEERRRFRRRAKVAA